MHEKFLVLKTFTYPHELAILRAHLESEGIECFVKDELTIQVNPFYSNAIGGIKLQVREKDFEAAREILLQSGYKLDDPMKPIKIYLWLEELTSKMPLLKRLQFGMRILILIASVFSLVLLITFLVTLPTLAEKLTDGNWCVDRFTYDGKQYQPDSKNLIVFKGCRESISFQQNGTVSLPGFNFNAILAKWKIEGSQLVIQQADTFGFVYDGNYSIHFTREGMLLVSEKTTIRSHHQTPFQL